VQILEIGAGRYARRAWALVSDQPARAGQMAARKVASTWEVALADGDGWLAVDLIAEQGDNSSAKTSGGEITNGD